ncbi:MAG TPA: ribosome biogenesis GTP-binding protein YihA/YsxC [candidate division Zixibacteria bacterium]|nr:YihA family ribosome biogenesis GTP-binding protein [candidate division Zixibacteria bacterium]MDD4916751.1 ribosome biogenesis GTP-binding protein YihA/YsxC [candidate division Zixibacteria bacterium]MDM7973808.1 ribosome biogenesis GTP-binding protein YihA/YsxC [candidate division Zixibacteria bacterium]HOD65353.1 ribosome biogenesis GTP-binding protein YihA/YsxC [candidate division Zixibacteria bacterium]HPC11391.1 ribosome biogenesis GTP-binding protein YihA/YsxC [candidate division Zixi
MATAPTITTCDFVGSFVSAGQAPADRRPHIAFAGRSNVGKSSLLNRLVGRRKIARVSSDPGKTRALNFYLVNSRFYFVDLPGYGYARVSRQMRAEWGRLLESYLNGDPHLAGLVLLLDARRDPTEQDFQLVAWLAARGIPTLVAVTKTDKLNRDQTNRKIAAVERLFNAPALAFSAVSGLGKNELLGAIFDLVNERAQDIGAPRHGQKE